MCANRRAFQRLGHELQLSVGVGGDVSEEVLLEAAENAYMKWRDPIKRCLGNAREGAMSLLALINYPRAWKAEKTDGNLKVPTDQLPEEVKDYALGGAVNVIVADETSYTISVPVGCTMWLLCDLCNKATTSYNMKEYESFRTVSRSVGTDKGHFFERLVACELTFMSSKLYETLLLTTGMKVSPVPSMLGKSFEYHARIHEADWSAKRVFCVSEDATFKGQRLVDVGFPVTESESNVTWKIFCELKVVQDKNNLWKMCWNFFQKMQDIGVGDSNKNFVAVFLSFHEFFTHEPTQKDVKDTNVSAHDSREFVLRLVKEKQNHFAVVDATGLAKANTVLPLVDLYDIIGKKEPTNSGVTELSNEFQHFYASSSQPELPIGESKQKRLRIS